jgi:type IV secretion system protein VirB10
VEKNKSSVEDIQPDVQPRGDFSLTGGKNKKKSVNKLLIVIGIGAGLAILSISGILFAAYHVIVANNPDHGIDESKVKADSSLVPVQKEDNPILKMKEKWLLKDEKPKTPLPPPVSTAKTQPKPQESVPQQPSEPSPALLRKLGGGVSVTDQGNAGGSTSGDSQSDLESKIRAQAENSSPVQSGESLGGMSLTSASGNNDSRGDLANLGGTKYAATKAYMSPDRKFLLKKRTNIQCATYTGIRTDHPGFVTCYLTQPLYSADGEVILADAGAELQGEQTVEVKTGQTSAFTSWQTLDMSNGVRADLAGLGTNATGESGTDAVVVNHWGQRIGGAVMLSLFEDSLQAGMNATQKNNSSFTFNNSESTANNMASKVLDNYINITSTGYVPPAQVINVIVAQDIDFSSVFKTIKAN